MIVPVENHVDLRTFVHAPWALYRRSPGWTPPHRASELRFHDPVRGPFFTFGAAQSFLALDGRRVRGRITAHVNHAYNAHHHTSVGGFGFLDAEPDGAVVGPLLDAAETWLAQQGCTAVWGPLEFCLYDRVGLQIEGFERALPMNAGYHAPGLHASLAAAGYAPKRDATVFSIPVPHQSPRSVQRVVERCRVPGLRIRRYRPRRLSDEAHILREVADRAFADHWLYFPLPQALVDFQAEELAALVRPAHVVFAEIDSAPVGVMVVVPDLGPLLRATSGRLIPWGLPGFWRQRRAPRELLIVLLAVVPQYRTLGVVAHLIDAVVQSGIQRHCRRICTTWVDEGNLAMVNTFRRFGGTAYARYRVLEKPLAPR
jgi:GNAT superfamily N-acetyltransferase